jgi:hypothetical protein
MLPAECTEESGFGKVEKYGKGNQGSIGNRSSGNIAISRAIGRFFRLCTRMSESMIFCRIEVLADGEDPRVEH